MTTDDLRKRLRDAATADRQVTLTLAEAETVLEVLDAAKASTETTIDRNVARRKMERLRMAVARLRDA
jgi:hypothetical protein